MMMNNRQRSSSRCSASVASSPWPRRRGSCFIPPLDGLALAFGLGGRKRLRRGRLVVVTRDRVLELAHTGTERPTDLRQTLAAEEQQRDQQDEDDVPGLRQSGHWA